MKLTRTHLSFVAAGALGVLLLGGFAARGGSPCARGGFSEERAEKFATFMVEDLLDEVDATDTQRTQILAVKDRMLGEALSLHQAKKATHDTLMEEWDAETPDSAKIHALIDQRIDDLRKTAHKAADAMVEVHGVLTPEQRDIVAEMHEDRVAGH